MSQDHPSPESFAGVVALIELLSDPKDIAKRCGDLQKLLNATVAAQAKLDNDRVEHDRAVAAATREADEREAKLRKREVDVAIAERDLAAREKVIAAARPPRYPYDPNISGTLTREPYIG